MAVTGEGSLNEGGDCAVGAGAERARRGGNTARGEVPVAVLFTASWSAVSDACRTVPRCSLAAVRTAAGAPVRDSIEGDATRAS